ncbi:MAG TPA: hypothetical protein VNI84_19215 [Pyrinomonadaceae bacterium]|nr:hypothetical protein [Pyrinomonadaceae bacterium]
MIKLEKIFSLFSALFAVLIFSFLIYIVWSYAKNSALHSCVYSIGSDVVEYSSEIGSFARSSENWYVLTDDETKSALKNISFQNCSQSNSQPQDMKERKFKIAVKGNGGHSFEVMVWSKGFDNISGTSDDIVFPVGEKVPN